MAVTVEDLLVWAYRRQLAQIADEGFGDDRDFGPGGGASGILFFEAMALGYVIPSTGSAARNRIDTHPDAAAVHHAVVTLPGGMAEPVIRHAAAGGRPCGARPEWSPRETVTGADGVERPKVLYDLRGRYSKQPWLVPVVCTHTWGEILAVRRAWLAWRGALALVARHFRSHPHLLARWRVTDSLPPVAPWRDGGHI